MKSFIGWSLVILGGLGYFVFHCYTVFIVYMLHGILWAFISFCAPGFAELIMAGASIAELGFLNGYFITWIGTIALFSVGKMFLAWADVATE